MQLSDDFHNVFYDPSLLPSHAKSSLKKIGEQKGIGFLVELIEGVRHSLEKNYGIPMEFTEIHGCNQFVLNLRKSYTEFTDVRYCSDFVYGIVDIALGDELFNRAETHNLREWYTKLMLMMLVVSEFKESTEEGHEGMCTRLYNADANNPNGSKRRVRAKFSRTWNTLFPGMPHSLVDALSDKWLSSFGSFDEDKYHFHIGETGDDFEMVYQLREGPTANIETTSVFSKHLSTSCMQYAQDDEDGWDYAAIETGIHCAASYAIDEEYHKKFPHRFKILYLTDSPDPHNKKANLYGRSLFVEFDEETVEWGPIYVCSEIFRKFMINKIINFKDNPAYKDKTSKFINKTDIIRYEEYPMIWGNVPMTPYFTEGGTHLTIEEYKEISKDKDETPVVFPYIDVGKKMVYPYPDHETGKMFLRILNSRQDGKDGICRLNARLGYIDPEEGHFYPGFYSTEHRGVNHIPPIIMSHKCNYCDKKYFDDGRIDPQILEDFGYCHDCAETRLFFDEIHSKYVEKDGTQEHVYIRIYDAVDPVKKEFVKFTEANNIKKLDFDKFKFNFYPAGTAYDNFSLKMTKLKNIKEVIPDAVILDDVHLFRDGKLIFPLVCKKEDTINIDGKLYFWGDKRICFDENMNLTLDESCKIIFFSDGSYSTVSKKSLRFSEAAYNNMMETDVTSFFVKEFDISPKVYYVSNWHTAYFDAASDKYYIHALHALSYKNNYEKLYGLKTD